MRKLHPLALPTSLALFLAIFTTLPYLAAFWHAAPGQHFMGFLVVADDANAYLAIMRQGFEGDWGWSNRYTTAAPGSSSLFVFWLALGHLAALAHLTPYAVFQLARLGGIFALVFAAWLFVRDFLPVPARTFGLLFVTLVPGAGLVLLLLHEPVLLGQATYAIDFHFPEASLFVSSLALPHYIWAATFIALGCVFTFAAAERASWKAAAAAALAWCGLGLIHPQMVPFMALLFAFALICRPASKQGMLLAALVFAVQAPYVLHAYLDSTSTPYVAQWLAQGGDDFVPPPLSFLVSLAPQLLPALVGIAIALRRRSRRDFLLLAWLALEVAVLYLPMPFPSQRRRFLDGIYLPLAILAVEGLYAIGLRIAPYFRHLLAFGYVAVGALLPVFMVAALVLHPPAGAFLSDSHQQALAALAASPGGFVLSDASIGLYIPSNTQDSVYVGHFAETIDYPAKASQVCSLHRSGDTAALVQLVQDIHARYWVWTSTCSPSFNFDPTQIPAAWQLVYAGDGVRVYRVF